MWRAFYANNDMCLYFHIHSIIEIANYSMKTRILIVNEYVRYYCNGVIRDCSQMNERATGSYGSWRLFH